MLALPFLALASCQSDEPNFIPDSVNGKEVEFTYLGNSKTRTVYEDDWDVKGTQEIYWGSYVLNDFVPEQIKIYCKQGAKQIATYKVNYEGNGETNQATSIEKTGEYGIQWGEPAERHNFYAFYPSYRAGDEFLDQDGKTIKASVTPNQSPVKYRMVKGDVATDVNALTQASKNTTHNKSSQHTIFGLPDMSAAIMHARNHVDNQNYGKAVNLQFDVIADVLDITVNGPIKPNHLAGNGHAASSIIIRSVKVEAKNKKTVLSGSFEINMDTKEVSNAVGDSFILLNTTITENKVSKSPELFWRADDNSCLDKLRLRAFLVPGQVKDLNELQIVVSTNYGEYTRVLNSDKIISGAIHRMQMPYFEHPGMEFDFERWMSQLDPNVYISELSLPGSWHSPLAEYQSASLADQYKAGVRAFEVQTQVQEGWTNHHREYQAVVYGKKEKRLSEVLNDIGGLIRDDEFVVFEVGYISDKYRDNWYEAIENELAAATKVYRQEITANTTIGDVKGHIVVKINTNGAYNEGVWSKNTPALFSRWIDESAIIPKEVNLKWGQSVDPEIPIEGGLKWFFTQGHNVGDVSVAGINSTLTQRCQALLDFGASTYEYYKSGTHDNWFYCLIGGILKHEQEYGNEWYGKGTKELARQQNPFMVQVLTNPLRTASPYGIVMMNFASNDETGREYHSPELIRQIINNNMAFTLNRRPAK